MIGNAVAAALGVGRLPAVRSRTRREHANFSDAQQAAIVADQASPRYWLAGRAELRAYAEFREHARSTALPTGMPIGYITAGSYPERLTRATFGMTAAEFRTFHIERQAAALGALSPAAVQVIAERSGHMVQHDQPELVAAEIRRLVAA